MSLDAADREIVRTRIRELEDRVEGLKSSIVEMGKLLARLEEEVQSVERPNWPKRSK